MDYLLFYSKYSRKCTQLLEEFPFLSEKAVSIDSLRVRDHLQEISIVAVPTLAIIYNQAILDRIVGAPDIEQWVYTTLYHLRHVPTNDADVSQSVETVSETQSITTPIEQIPLQQEDISPPSSPQPIASKELSAADLAKKMQTQREQYISATAPLLPNNSRVG
jgi:hypothetical protein